MEALLSGANSAIAIMFVLGLCLFFHELGHFLAAKASRMMVHEFALGFGPILWKRTMRGTLYTLRIVPFGGFVRIAGMEMGERDAPNGFYSRPQWQRHVVIFAGVFMNMVLAVLLYWSVNVVSGIPTGAESEVIVRKIFSDTPAQVAGLQPNDRIVGVGGSLRSTQVESVRKGSLAQKLGIRPNSRIFQIGDTPVAIPAEVLAVLKKGVAKGDKIWLINGEATDIGDAMLAVDPPSPEEVAALPDSFDPNKGDSLAHRALGVTFGTADQFTVHRYISSHPNEKLDLQVLRTDEMARVQITPAASIDRVEMVDPSGKLISPHRSVGRIGVTLGPELRKAGVIEGFGLAVAQSVNSVATVILTFKAMFLGKIAAEPAGPIGIMAMTAETAKLGWASVLGLCGLISANLAVINLLPIPPFDGGQIIILLVEGIFRRQLNQRLEMFVRVAGLVLVLNLFLALAYKDIMNLVRYGTY